VEFVRKKDISDKRRKREEKGSAWVSVNLLDAPRSPLLNRVNQYTVCIMPSIPLKHGNA
jgi:hypothetical protein